MPNIFSRHFWTIVIHQWTLTYHYTLQRLCGPGHAKTCLKPYANNKVADQPAHPRSLISTFVVRCLDSMICILALSKVSRFKVAFRVMWLIYGRLKMKLPTAIPFIKPLNNKQRDHQKSWRAGPPEIVESGTTRNRGERDHQKSLRAGPPEIAESGTTRNHGKRDHQKSWRAGPPEIVEKSP